MPPFEFYYIEYTLDNSTVIEVTPYPAMNFTTKILLNYTQYFVRVALNNSIGLGEYSDPPVTGRTNSIGE